MAIDACPLRARSRQVRLAERLPHPSAAARMRVGIRSAIKESSRDALARMGEGIMREVEREGISFLRGAAASPMLRARRLVGDDDQGTSSRAVTRLALSIRGTHNLSSDQRWG